MNETPETPNRCPITLESIPEGHAFTHEGQTFDATALYTYLLQAPHLTNPVNRIIFTTLQLEELETLIEQIYGKDCILRDQDAISETDSDVVVLDMQDDPDWFDEVALMNMFSTVIEEHSDDVIRLRVDLNAAEIPDNTSLSSDLSTRSSSSLSSSTGSLNLPPSRVFPSLVDIINDPNRSRRMADNLQLLQFLDFEATDIVRRMLELLDPTSFHNIVWNNTHFAVMQAVVEYLRAEESTTFSEEDEEALVIVRDVGEPPPSPEPTPTYNLQVHYSDEWAIYRDRLQNQLRERYIDVMRDIRRIGETHQEVSRRTHITLVQDYAIAHPDRQRGCEGVLNFLALGT